MGETDWIISFKPTFLAELLAVPSKDNRLIQEKIEALARDPSADGKLKKRLKEMGGKLHRLRAGDFRIFYTFDKPHLSLMAVRRRAEDTYKGDVDDETLAGDVPDLPATAPPAARSWEAYMAETPKRPLPEPITESLLHRLRVPVEYHARLVRITTQEDLLSCPGVPDAVLLRIDEVMFERPLDEIANQPDLIAESAEDLIRYKEGDLRAFLLKLSPEQERLVRWRADAKGPTLIKGSPGTGKSTVALYRVREYINALRRAGTAEPRILMTTYTNALVAYSESLLEVLLGEDLRCVEVRTADSLTKELVDAAGLSFAPIDHRALLDHLRQARNQAVPKGGTAFERMRRREVLVKLSDEYLLEEVCTVIHANGFRSVEEYLAAPRPGRGVPLSEGQRRAVWEIREVFDRIVKAAKGQTWQSLRATAAALVAAGKGKRYDAVIIDEAQDLDPASLRMLVGLCSEANRLLLTADANQSIYGGAFRWGDVHQSLRFSGRTGILGTDYRSTREIGEAADAYLREGRIDAETRSKQYFHSGPLPVAHVAVSTEAEADLLARFLRGAARELRLGLSACVVLVPSNAAGESLAERLSQRGVPSKFMKGKELDLKAKEAKVITMTSAKGLEFPIIAIAGLAGSQFLARNAEDDAEVQEAYARKRRTLFVAITRAMRALLVVLPEGNRSPLLSGVGGEHWVTIGSPTATDVPLTPASTGAN